MQGKKTGGRQLGTVNKLTRSCREAIEFASDALGGAERLAEWAAESPENEATFWRHIYPRLLPSSVNVLLCSSRTLIARQKLARKLSSSSSGVLVRKAVGCSRASWLRWQG